MKPAKDISLRQKAEQLLKNRQALKTADHIAGAKLLSEVEAIKLVHELEVHQIELELQKKELQLAKQKAETNTEKYTNLYDFSPSGYFTLDSDFRICELNFNAAKMLGKERLKLINSNFSLFITPDKRSVFADFLDKVAETKTKQSCEVQLSIKESPTIFVHIEGVFSETDQKFLLTVVDINEYKLIENELLKAKKEAERYLDVSGSAFVSLDINGDIVLVNQKVLEILEYDTREELMGKNWFDSFIPSEIIEPVKQVFTTVMKGSIDGVENFENEVVTKSGKRRSIYWSNSYIKDEKGQIIYLLSSGIDITKRKQAEEALLLSEATIKNKLKAITEPDGDISTLELSDIIDTEALQNMMEDFHKLTGFLGAVVDISGKVLVAVGWQDICTKFHRCNPYSVKNCFESDTILTQGVPEGTFKSYRCKNNMWDTVTPLMVGGKHVGNIFIGQYLLEGEVPAVELFRKQARKYGFDEEEYLAALEKVPRFSKEMVDVGMQFYSKLTGIISKLSFSTIQQSRMLAERKQAEEKLIKSENEFRLLAESMPQIVWITLADGMNIYFNKQWVDYTGLSLEDSCGNGWNKPFHPDDQKRAWNAWQNAVKNNDKYSLECRLRRKDGEYLWWLVRGVPVADSEGNIVKWFGTCTDIQSIKESENELKAAKEKAEESDRLKSAFLANMSHEIRTPMNGILGFAELLKEPGLTGEEQQVYIKIIEKSGARMLNIINDIVSISKIESGLMEVNIQESNINEQIEYIYTFFKPEVKAKGFQFSFKNALPFEASFVNTDKEKLFAILINLVKNAIKFTESGSIELGYIKKGLNLEFYVKDTGIGIDSHRQEAVFERFIQADISDKNALQGAGLGLSISKAYVEMIGGKLWVESEKGKGSVFYFTIPYKVNFKESIEMINDAGNGDLEIKNKKLKILIVEDDEASDLLMSLIISEISREILHAKGGLEAIELCRNNPDTDLILMDIKMPGIDGYEATQQIRQFNNEVIIIAQTAYGLTGDREKALLAGCNEHLSKPIVRNKLLSVINQYFIR